MVMVLIGEVLLTGGDGGLDERMVGEPTSGGMRETRDKNEGEMNEGESKNQPSHMATDWCKSECVRGDPKKKRERERERREGMGERIVKNINKVDI